MGLRYRKSFGSGPVRMTVSKSGVGWSAGTKGARVTKKAGGGYRTTVGANGVSYVKDHGGKKSSGDIDSASVIAWCIVIVVVVVAFILMYNFLGTLDDGTKAQDTSTTSSEPSTVETEASSNANSEMVYVTETGSKYHANGCKHLVDNCIELSLDEAISYGFTPCVTCH